MIRRAAYWLAVLVVSLAIVAGLVYLLESCDAPSLEAGALRPSS